MGTDEYNNLSAKLDSIKEITLLGIKSVLTINEVVLLTGLSKAHIYRLTSTKGIPYYKQNGKCIYFKKAEVEDWLLQNRIPTNAEIESRATTHVALKPIGRSKK